MPTSSSNVVRHGTPSRTAHWVATLRAVHQLLDEPLVLADPVALPLLGRDGAAALRDHAFTLNDPLTRGLRAAIVARSRFVEDELARCVGNGVGQYVVLGAGLDTFAYRSPFEAQGLKVFEVDHVGTQGWKRTMLSEAGIAVPPTVAFIPLDFERDGLIDHLVRGGFRVAEPACVSWMGVTPYLTNDAVLRTLRELARCAPGTCVSFDYRVPVPMADPVARVIDGVIAAQAAAAGEPWLSSFEPDELQRRMLEAGFGSARTITPDELNQAYFDRRKDGLRTGGGFRIMCARTAS